MFASRSLWLIAYILSQTIDNCSQQGTVALTFDGESSPSFTGLPRDAEQGFTDGPYNYEAQVVSALDGGKGTFFLNVGSGVRIFCLHLAHKLQGANYACIYDKADSIKALYDAGHTLGSHTWSHADLTQLDESGINDGKSCSYPRFWSTCSQFAL